MGWWGMSLVAVAAAVGNDDDDALVDCDEASEFVVAVAEDDEDDEDDGMSVDSRLIAEFAMEEEVEIEGCFPEELEDAEAMMIIGEGYR